MLSAISITPIDFLATLTPQTLVLTPNRRLATRLRQSLTQQLSHGQSRYAPNILAYQDWLTQTQQQLHLHGIVDTQLLTGTAMSWLFAKTLPQDITLLASPERLAETAKQAWQLAHEGCLPWQQLKQHPHLDYQWFANWAAEVKSMLNEHKLTDIYAFVTQHQVSIVEAVAKQYTHIAWYGFMDFLPQQQQLQTACQHLGIHQAAFVAIHPYASNQPTQLVAAADPKLEIRAMLEHAMTLQAQGQNHIACVVPQLAQHRAHIVTEVWRCFEADKPWPHYRKDAPVNVSGGYYLSELAPVQTAISLISLWQQQMPYTTLATLLLSPYWGQTNLSANFADLERIWRQAVATELPLAMWLRLLPDNHDASTMILQSWQPLVNQARQLPSYAYPSDWVKRIKQQLLALHWPGYVPIDSWHYQVTQALIQALEQLAGYDSLMGQLSLNAMLQLWQHDMNQRLFQAETQGQAVEILGILEATGLIWDSLWVSQLQADNFPESPKPNPLLPLAWQQAAGLPHSDARREQAYAQTLLNTWQSQSAQLTLSYSQHIDGLAAEGSLLLEPWQAALHSRTDTDRGDTAHPCERIEASQHSVQLEPIQENPVPALEGTLKGGSYHIQRFIDCSFKAFAYHRLGAEPLMQKSASLNPLQRGQAIHRSLQWIWQQLGTQQALIDLGTDDTYTLVQQAAHTALMPWQHQLPLAIWQQQVAWVTKIIQAWLNFERTRAPFRIHSLEQAHTLELAGLNIKLRSDRIDIYADGTLLVIDYKTGIAQVSDSFKEPLLAPQMPLYLLAINADSAGFAYVTLKPGKVAWDGVADTVPEPELQSFTQLSKKQSTGMKTYATQLDAWQHELETLITACAHNQADLNPRTPEVCRRCDLASLCRRDELITG